MRPRSILIAALLLLPATFGAAGAGAEATWSDRSDRGSWNWVLTTNDVPNGMGASLMTTLGTYPYGYEATVHHGPHGVVGWSLEGRKYANQPLVTSLRIDCPVAGNGVLRDGLTGLPLAQGTCLTGYRADPGGNWVLTARFEIPVTINGVFSEPQTVPIVGSGTFYGSLLS